MSSYHVDGLADLYEQGDVFVRKAGSVAQASGSAGADATGTVAVALDGNGAVARVSVVSGWPGRVDPQRLGDAVVEAVRDAAVRRLSAWGEAFGQQAQTRPEPAGQPADRSSVSVGCRAGCGAA